MEPLTPALVRAEWDSASVFLYPRQEPHRVAAQSVAAVEAALAEDPDGCLQGIRGYRQGFPEVVRLLGSEWCFDAAAYANAVEVEYQSRLLGMAAGQLLIASRARALKDEMPGSLELDPGQFEQDLVRRFGRLVVRVPGTQRVDLMSPRVLGEERLGFIVVPVLYHQASEDFAQHVRALGSGQQGYETDPLGSVIAGVTGAPGTAPPLVATELVVSVIASMAGNVDTLPVDRLGAAVNQVGGLFGEEPPRDGLVHLLAATLTDFAIAHEAGHWWAQHAPANDASQQAAQEAAAHHHALSMLVAYHHFFRNTGLFDAMIQARLSPVVAPLLIQTLHVCFLRYLFKLTTTVILRIAAKTGEDSLQPRLMRLAQAHRKDLLHFRLMLENVKDLVYADAASWDGEAMATVDADVQRVLDFQRALFERFDDDALVLGPIDDGRLVSLLRALQQVMPPWGQPQ